MLFEVSVELAKQLICDGVVRRVDVEAALLRQVQDGLPFLVALSERVPNVMPSVTRVLGGNDDTLPIEQRPNLELFGQLPQGMCETLLAYPVGLGVGGIVEILTAEPLGPVVRQEFERFYRARVYLRWGSFGYVRSQLQSLGSAWEDQTLAESQVTIPPPAVVPAVSTPVPSLPPTPTSSPRPTEPGRLEPPATERGNWKEWGGKLKSILRDDAYYAALAELAVADNAENVAKAMLVAVAGCCHEGLVFGRRGDSLLSRFRLGVEGHPETFECLELDLAAVSALNDVFLRGQVLTSLSRAEAEGISLNPGYVCATAVFVGERPALLLVASGFNDASEVRERSQHITRAAGDALLRVVVESRR